MRKNVLRPVEIDVSQIPDLVPVLAVLSCAVKGKMRIYNAGRLRYKESDRLHAMAHELEKLGADITEYEDSLVINGTGALDGERRTATLTTGSPWLLQLHPVSPGEPVVIRDPIWLLENQLQTFMKEFASLGGLWNERDIWKLFESHYLWGNLIPPRSES